MILNCSKLNKAFGTDVILSSASFVIEEKEKAAIVGVNGAGKTTLLRIITGEEPADSGEVYLSAGKSIGYLAQYQDLDSENTIYEELQKAKQDLIDMEQRMSRLYELIDESHGEEQASYLAEYDRLLHDFTLRDGYAYKSEITGVLKGLGFSEEDGHKPCSKLSGGEKTRVSLGKILLTKPDLILLDEPTNHLDIGSVSWLEGFLASYDGAVVLVSHDRYFLDHVVTKVIDIDRAKVSVYLGNYTQYAEKKRAEREAELKHWQEQQNYIAHQEKVIEKLRSYNREKSIKRAESRVKQLARLERLEKPVMEAEKLRINIKESDRSGNDVLSVRGLGKSFGEKELFSGVDLDIRRGEHVGIIGENGTGKTTFLKIINHAVEADTGAFRLGANVDVAYYDQEQQLLDDSLTLFDEIREAYPDMTDTEIRNVLATFLFVGDDVFKLVGDLSGGERGRLSLAKLLISPCNLLILDEPTNHLDIVSKEVLESALKQYRGTILFVSHDRYFINVIADRILNLKDGRFEDYKGNYDYYLEKKAENEAAAAVQNVKQTTQAAQDWKADKERQAKERKLKNEKAAIEARISDLEKRSDEINEELTREDVFTDMKKCLQLQQELQDIQNEIEDLFSRWEVLESL